MTDATPPLEESRIECDCFRLTNFQWGVVCGVTLPYVLTLLVKFLTAGLPGGG